MNQKTFWKLLSDARAGKNGNNTGAKKLTEMLGKLSPDEIRSFRTIWNEKNKTLQADVQLERYARNRWAAGGQLWYMDFCFWVVSMGEEAFAQIRSKPAAIEEFLDGRELTAAPTALKFDYCAMNAIRSLAPPSERSSWAGDPAKAVKVYRNRPPRSQVAARCLWDEMTKNGSTIIRVFLNIHEFSLDREVWTAEVTRR